MRQVITDSYYHKKYWPDSIWAGNGIYGWHVDPENHPIISRTEKPAIQREIGRKFNEGDPVLGVVWPSDYRVIYEIMSLDKNARFYDPMCSKEGPFGRYYPDRKKIEKEFLRYIKRSYITGLLVDELRVLGLQRVEQIMLLLAIHAFESVKEYDNFFFTKDISIEKIISKKRKRIGGRVDPMRFAVALAEERGESVSEAISEMIRLQNRLQGTEPFGEEYKAEGEFEGLMDRAMKTVEGVEIVVRLSDGQKRKILAAEVDDPFYRRVHGVSGERIFEGKIFFEGSQAMGLLAAFEHLRGVLTNRDILLTYNFLVKMGKVVENGTVAFSSVGGRLSLRKNLHWISSEKWKKAYDTKDWNFGTVFPPLEVTKLKFRCPECDNGGYFVGPEAVYCSKYPVCNFHVPRLNLEVFGIDKVDPETIIQAVMTGGAAVRDRDGRMRPVVLKKNPEKDRWALWLEAGEVSPEPRSS